MWYEMFNKKISITAVDAEFLTERYLSNYVYMQRVVKEIDGPMALKLLCLEKAGKDREQIVNRLYGIYNKYRREQDRAGIGLEKSQ